MRTLPGFTWLKGQMSEPDGSDFKPKRRVLVFLGVVLLLLLAMQLFNAIMPARPFP
jgi:hypothetical protein